MEIWDIFDKYRKKKEHTHKRGKDMHIGDYHIVVHVWIVNSRGEFLIQKRKVDKKGWPGMWDCAAAGSAILGDSSRDAAIRETEEEIGLDIEKDNLEALFTVKFAKGFDDNWLLRAEVDIEDLVLQEEEVEDVKWVSEDEIKDMLTRDEFIPFPFLDRLFEIINSDIRIKKANSKDIESLIRAKEIERYDYYNILSREDSIGNILVTENCPGRVEIETINISKEYNKREIYQEIISRIEILYPQADIISIKTCSKQSEEDQIYEEMGYVRLDEIKNTDDGKILVKYIKKEIYRMPDIKKRKINKNHKI